MDKKLTINRPNIRTYECVHLVAVLLNPEEMATLSKIMALRQIQEDSAIGAALRAYLPLAEQQTKAPIVPALPFQ